MPPESSNKNQNNFNNKQKESHATTPSASKTPNKHDSTESNEKTSLLEARIRQLEQ